MGAFHENIAEAVKRELLDPRFLSRNKLGHAGRVFYILPTTATNYTQFVEDHPAYKSGDGVVTTAAVYNTIDAAIGACTANQGDVIYVMSGHVETVTAASGIAADIAGISIVGVGNGQNRPRVDFTTAVGASFVVSAANVWIENIVFTGGIDALTGPIDIQASDCTMLNCLYRDVTGQATDGIVTTAAATRFRLLNYRHEGATAAGANSAIALVGSDDCEIGGLYIDGNFAVGAIDVRTTAVLNLWLHDFTIRTRNAADIALIDTITGSTGMIEKGFIRLQDNAANITEAITGATWVFSDNIWVVNLAGEKAMLYNAVASTDI